MYLENSHSFIFIGQFTDLLLICKEQDIRVLRGFQPKYKVKVILDVEGMQVRATDFPQVTYGRYLGKKSSKIVSLHRSLLFSLYRETVALGKLLSLCGSFYNAYRIFLSE